MDRKKSRCALRIQKRTCLIIGGKSTIQEFILGPERYPPGAYGAEGGGQATPCLQSIRRPEGGREGSTQACIGIRGVGVLELLSGTSLRGRGHTVQEGEDIPDRHPTLHGSGSCFIPSPLVAFSRSEGEKTGKRLQVNPLFLSTQFNIFSPNGIRYTGVLLPSPLSRV